MTDASLPPNGPSVDSVTAPAVDGEQSRTTPAPTKSSPEVKRAKTLLTVVGGTAYGAYVLWLCVLLLMLPSPTGALQQLVLLGALSSMVGALVVIAAAAFAFKRIAKADVSVAVRRMSLQKLIA